MLDSSDCCDVYLDDFLCGISGRMLTDVEDGVGSDNVVINAKHAIRSRKYAIIGSKTSEHFISTADIWILAPFSIILATSSW